MEDPDPTRKYPDQEVWVWVPFRPHPQYGSDFPEENSGKTPETLSELFLELTSRVRLGSPKPYSSRRLKPPEHFQNCLPLSTAGDASFFRSGSGEGSQSWSWNSQSELQASCFQVSFFPTIVLGSSFGHSGSFFAYRRFARASLLTLKFLLEWASASE